MCIAIYQPPHKEISNEILENCHENNKDGCGFAYINTDDHGIRRVTVKKTMDFEVFMRQYTRARRIQPDSPFIIHFRIKTHGKKNRENCHPFLVDHDHAIVHNGIITGVPYSDKHSDTAMFVDKYLKKLPKGWMFNEGIVKLIENAIGASKIVALDVDHNVTIMNEKSGYWVDEVWYSNSTYKKSSYKSYGGYRGNYGSDYTSSSLATPPPPTGNSGVVIGETTWPPTRRFGYVYKYSDMCDLCDKEITWFNGTFYYSLGEIVGYCESCANQHCVLGYNDPEEVGYHVINDYDNASLKEIEGYPQEYFAKWDNPWKDGCPGKKRTRDLKKNLQP